MGTGGLSTLLFGRTRTAVLSLLYSHLDESFYVRQMMRETGAGQGAVQRELQTLANTGLILRKKIGNQVFYQANRESPVFSEIRGLIQKTSGVGEVLRAALSPLRSQITVAFVYGSIASQTEKAQSDVDVMVIGGADFGDVVAKLSSAEKTLRREINPAVYTVAEWKSKLSRGNHFLQSVMKTEKVFVFGSPDELRKLSPKRLAGRASN
jgi:uncharacterized protein